MPTDDTPRKPQSPTDDDWRIIDEALARFLQALAIDELPPLPKPTNDWIN